jgi:hypothetical protein
VATPFVGQKSGLHVPPPEEPPLPLPELPPVPKVPAPEDPPVPAKPFDPPVDEASLLDFGLDWVLTISSSSEPQDAESAAGPSTSRSAAKGRKRSLRRVLNGILVGADT